MFDVSFTEMLVIAVVALVVIGPERLPKVARTVGHLLGRAQRYVSDVKGDIRREMELDELRTLRAEMEDAARTIKTTVSANVDEMRKEFDETTRDVKELAQEAAQSATVATEAAHVAVEAAPHADVAGGAPVVAVDASQPVVSTPAHVPAAAVATPDPVITTAHVEPSAEPLIVPPLTPVRSAQAELEAEPLQTSLFPSDILPPLASVPADTHQAAAAVPRDSEKT